MYGHQEIVLHFMKLPEDVAELNTIDPDELKHKSHFMGCMARAKVELNFASLQGKGNNILKERAI